MVAVKKTKEQALVQEVKYGTLDATEVNVAISYSPEKNEWIAAADLMIFGKRLWSFYKIYGGTMPNADVLMKDIAESVASEKA